MSEAAALARKQRIHSAWMELSLNPEFRLVFEQDLQQHFGMFAPVFQAGDGFNPHAAAARDGEKRVLNFIARRLARGTAMLDADEVIPERETVSEFQGTPPP